MHQVVIPPSVVERVMARRGREHVYEDFDPTRTALVVIDLQNAFMMEGVAHSPCREAIEIVPNVNRLARGLRAAGGTVVWIQTAFTEESLVSWSAFHDMSVPARTKKRSEALTPGSIGYALWAELEAVPEDLYVEKLRFSAFIQGSTDLERILRERGIDVDKLEWLPMPCNDGVIGVVPHPEEVAAPVREGLTIAEAKYGLSVKFGVPEEAIQIVING